MTPVTGFAHALAAALLGAGLGVQVFLSFLVAPSAFRLLDRPVAVRLMEGLFPGYYLFGVVVTTGVLVLMLFLALARPAAPLRWGALNIALFGVGVLALGVHAAARPRP
jgi:hypothetical protein